ncbi:glycoside hydrolase family 28 protein [Oidiodendron maius Zn]|uniref:Glycoside hydrolase family 28 protein n=1 Tax=Oidiodendron maius (strain Zn) TaxID=913774 RepID=A0A0C3GB31_OIDMZ|nr:glycoside hydrolase family 28 protein [Oidiodendron maius Zn]
MALYWLALLLPIFQLPSLTYGQLIGPVGPTTPLSRKVIECNILDYGAKADNETNAAPAIQAAYDDCVRPNPGSRLIVPEGNYLITEDIVLANATNWAFQLDGLITASYTGNYSVPREDILWGPAGVQALNETINGEGDGLFLLDILVIVNAVDFEFYSSNGLGAIQGQGYLYRNANNIERPRLVRIVSPTNASIHDLILIDSPKFHFVLDFATNVEVYHLTIRGANLGSYDGIDATGTNYYIHDNEITNRDECVSVKSPSNYALVENLVCNQAGSGISIGSLNVSAEISNIYARNISIIQGNNVAFIKTYPGGSGYVTNITFENIRSKASLYGLDVNQYWQNVFTPDTGAVTLSNLTFRNITGSLADGALRPPLYLIGNDLFLTDSVTIEDFSLWTEEGSYIVNKINNIYGYGDDVYGPNDGLGIPPSGTTDVTLSTFTSSYTISASPTGWVEPAFPTWAAASTGYGTAVPIPVYTPAALWMPQGDYDKHYWGTF